MVVVSRFLRFRGVLSRSDSLNDNVKWAMINLASGRDDDQRPPWRGGLRLCDDRHKWFFTLAQSGGRILQVALIIAIIHVLSFIDAISAAASDRRCSSIYKGNDACR